MPRPRLLDGIVISARPGPGHLEATHNSPSPTLAGNQGRGTALHGRPGAAASTHAAAASLATAVA